MDECLIGNKLGENMVFMANIANEGLIDMDFLRAHRLIIDFVANKISIVGDQITARCQKGQGKST